MVLTTYSAMLPQACFWRRSSCHSSFSRWRISAVRMVQPCPRGMGGEGRMSDPGAVPSRSELGSYGLRDPRPITAGTGAAVEERRVCRARLNCGLHGDAGLQGAANQFIRTCRTWPTYV